MSRKADGFKFLSISTDLINKHMAYKDMEQIKGDKESSILKAYKMAESSLLSHIRQEVQQFTDIDSLTLCYRDACYGLGALRLRYDLLKDKLVKGKGTGSEALKEAIDDGVVTDDKFPEWGCLGNNHKSDNLIQEAFDTPLITPYETDKKALATMILLDFISGNNYKGLKFVSVLTDIEYGCTKYLLEGATKDSNVIGYYDGYEFNIDIANKEFIRIFSDALKKLLSQSESVQVLEMLQYLQEQVIIAWTRHGIVRPFEVYNEVEKLLDAYKTPHGITYEIENELVYSGRFAVHTRYSETGVHYELNTNGLKAFVYLLHALGLSTLQEVSMLIDKIKAVCT